MATIADKTVAWIAQTYPHYHSTIDKKRSEARTQDNGCLIVYKTGKKHPGWQ